MVPVHGKVVGVRSGETSAFTKQPAHQTELGGKQGVGTNPTWPRAFSLCFLITTEEKGELDKGESEVTAEIRFCRYEFTRPCPISL